MDWLATRWQQKAPSEPSVTARVESSKSRGEKEGKECSKLQGQHGRYRARLPRKAEQMARSTVQAAAGAKKRNKGTERKKAAEEARLSSEPDEPRGAATFQTSDDSNLCSRGSKQRKPWVSFTLTLRILVRRIL